MKTCKSCGSQMDDNAAFCFLCGAKQNEDSQAQITPPSYTTQPQPFYTPAPYAPTPQVGNVQPPVRDMSAREVLKKHACSKRILAFIILMSVTTVLSFVYSAFFTTSPESFIDKFQGTAPKEVDLQYLSTLYSILTPILALVGSAPSIFCIIGFLFIRKECLKNTFKTTGFSILYIVTLVCFVLFCLTAGYCVVISMLLMLIPATTLYFLSLILILLLILSIPFTLFLKFFTTIKRLRLTFTMGEKLTIPIFLPVAFIAIIIITLISAVSTLLENPYNAVMFILAAASNILLAYCMFAYNKDMEMNILASKYNQGV